MLIVATSSAFRTSGSSRDRRIARRFIGSPFLANAVAHCNPSCVSMVTKSPSSPEVVRKHGKGSVAKDFLPRAGVCENGLEGCPALRDIPPQNLQHAGARVEAFGNFPRLGAGSEHRKHDRFRTRVTLFGERPVQGAWEDAVERDREDGPKNRVCDASGERGELP